jgi:hypothetical protein
VKPTDFFKDVPTANADALADMSETSAKVSTCDEIAVFQSGKALQLLSWKHDRECIEPCALMGKTARTTEPSSLLLPVKNYWQRRCRPSAPRNVVPGVQARPLRAA